MQFVVVTSHESFDSCRNCLKDMRIISIPEAFLVHTACKDQLEFANAIVHISFSFDYSKLLSQHKYCSVNGTIVFRHPVSFVTAIMSMVSEKILLDSGQIYCINKINNIEWQEDDRNCEFLGIVEAKLRLRILKHAEVTRNDMKYYAIPTSDLSVHECVKTQLRFLRCEFGVNVVYKEQSGTRTRRSIMFPTSLLNTDEIPHDGLYSILTMKLYPTHVFASPNQNEVFGCQDAGKEGKRAFDDYVSHFHTKSVMEHIKSDIMPRMYAMEAGEVYTQTLEFEIGRAHV